MNRWIFFLLFLPICSFSQYDATVLFPDLEGEDLLDQVVLDFKPGIILAYGPARDSMFSLIYNENDSLSCVYSGHRVYMDPELDPTEAVFMNGIDDGINTEHTYPRSKGAENGNPKSDMNHLFPTRVRVNSERGNLPFGEIPDQNTIQWFIGNTSQSNIPVSNIDSYSEWNGSLFEPREAHKGNVARAMMYFYTMYEAEAEAADPDFFAQQVNTFCQWHDEDPVDSLEWTRAFKIGDFQDGKVNPFVLDCSLAGRTYCNSVSSSCRSVSNIFQEKRDDFKLFPNPNDGEFSIEFPVPLQEVEILILDMLGNKVFTSKKKFISVKESVHFDLKPHFGLTTGLFIINLTAKKESGAIEYVNQLLILSME